MGAQPAAPQSAGTGMWASALAQRADAAVTIVIPFCLLLAAQALAALRGDLTDFFLAGPDFLPRQWTPHVTSSHTYDTGML